jgi:general secretion pathway protein L
MSGVTLVLFLGDPGRWLRIVDGGIVARGERPATAGDNAETVVAIVPAVETIVHNLALPDLTDAQARSAARIAIADTSMAPGDATHVAIGPEQDGYRTAVVIDAALMSAHVAALEGAGIEPDVIMPAALILPLPLAGYVRGIVGDEAVVRGHDIGFADDAQITTLIAPDGVATLDRDAVDAAIVAAVAHPPLDLRQGAFQPRRRWLGDAAPMRRLAWLTAACVATILIIPVATLLNMQLTIARVEARTLAIAEGALPPGTAVTNAVAQMNARLAETGGGDGGFLAMAGGVVQAIEALPGVDVASMTFDEQAGLRITLRSANPADLAQIEARLVATGHTVEAGPVIAAAGKSARDLTVRGR